MSTERMVALFFAVLMFLVVVWFLVQVLHHA
jgi:flagellar biogenesis protein FliO